jgi:hypothetical protein
MTDIQPSNTKETIVSTEPSVESELDNLQVSTPAAVENTKEIEEEAVTKKAEEQDQDDGDSETTSDDDNEPSKELGLVLSALQSTVKQNQENDLIAEKKVQERVEPEEELHSGDDFESETKSINDDIASVTTTTSTNVSHEEEKIVNGEHIVSEEVVVNDEKIASEAIITNDEEEKKEVVADYDEEEKKEVVADYDEEKKETIVNDNEENVITESEEGVAIPQTFEEIVQDILPPTPGIAPQRPTYELGGRSSEDVGDVESYSANLIALNKIDTKEIKANQLSPRQQERAGKFVYLLSFWGMIYLLFFV